MDGVLRPRHDTPTVTGTTGGTVDRMHDLSLIPVSASRRDTDSGAGLHDAVRDQDA